MKILYLSLTDTAYSVNAVYIKGLRENGVTVLDFFPDRKLGHPYRQIKEFYLKNRDADLIIVGDDCPKVVICARLFSSKPIAYNALCSVYERLVVSRRLVSPWSPKAVYYWLLDFLASHAANIVMLESQHQVDYFSKLFFVPRKKCFPALTGVDSSKFYFDPHVPKRREFTVIFRGRLLPEAGGEVIARAAKILENSGVKVVMQAFGRELANVKKIIDQLQPSNLELISEFIDQKDLRQLINSSHLSLGQLADHPRLSRTIPHKCYESLACKLPYLTGRNAGVLEILKEGETCLAFNPGDPEDLAKIILWAKDHPEDLGRIAKAGHNLYENYFKEKILSKKLLEYLEKQSLVFK